MKECDNTSGIHQDMQALLIPLTMELSSSDAEVLQENLPYFRRIGLSIEAFGPHTFAVQAVSPVFDSADISACVLDMVHELRSGDQAARWKQEKERRLVMAASRSAIPKNQRKTAEEAQRLIDQLMSCQFPYQCPSGKPTIIHMSHEDLAKQFKN